MEIASDTWHSIVKGLLFNLKLKTLNDSSRDPPSVKHGNGTWVSHYMLFLLSPMARATAFYELFFWYLIVYVGNLVIFFFIS